MRLRTPTQHAPGPSRRAAAVLVGLTLLVSVLTSVATPVGVAGAAIQDAKCVAEPATSTGTQSGATAVAVGERVRLGTEVPFDAGTLFQNVIANPDGTTYIASWLGVAPASGGALLADLSTIGLTIDGTPQTLTLGTQPSATGFVVDTTGPIVKVYFPGDTAALLANPSGTGAPSYVVPTGGQTFRVTYLATVAGAGARRGHPRRDVPGARSRTVTATSRSRADRVGGRARPRHPRRRSRPTSPCSRRRRP